MRVSKPKIFCVRYFKYSFRLGVISVVDELDFEQQQQYELFVRATDSVSGVYAEVPVSIALQDVNDCPPEFTQESYNVSISEAAPFGTSVLTVVARDNDTGLNQKIVYSLKKDNSTSTDFFHIDESDGTIYLKQSLDHEQATSHHFVVVATDQGVPSLSSTTHVWLSGKDISARFESGNCYVYICYLFLSVGYERQSSKIRATFVFLRPVRECQAGPVRHNRNSERS